MDNNLTARELFEKDNPEIVNCGIEKFSLIRFPLALSTMCVKEHIREDYSALEYIVLNLINAGVTGVDFLCKATGLTKRMIENIIQNEKDYNHIDDDFNVLEGGKITLGEENNKVGSEQYINHKCYENPRELQFDVLTGAVIAGERKFHNSYNCYAFNGEDEIFREYSVPSINTEYNILDLSERVKEDIINGLYSNYSKWEDVTIESISDIKVDELRSAFGYLVETTKPKMKFIAIRTQKLDPNGNPVISYEPIAIPKGVIDNSNNKYVEIEPGFFVDINEYDDDSDFDDEDLEDILRKHEDKVIDAQKITSERNKEEAEKKKKNDETK